MDKWVESFNDMAKETGSDRRLPTDMVCLAVYWDGGSQMGFVGQDGDGYWFGEIGSAYPSYCTIGGAYSDQAEVEGLLHSGFRARLSRTPATYTGDLQP